MIFDETVSRRTVELRFSELEKAEKRMDRRGIEVILCFVALVVGQAVRLPTKFPATHGIFLAIFPAMLYLSAAN